MLTVGSLFAGIGGFDLGLERTGGFEIKWQVEIDEYCQQVLAKHWPHVKRYENIRHVNRVEDVDVICGGFPCQDISYAGDGAGIGGECSGLWVEMARIIRLVRPRYVIVENVSALLGRGMGDVLRDLAACGYDAEWDVLPAAAFGAHHLRERVFIVAYFMRPRLSLRSAAGTHASYARILDAWPGSAFRTPMAGLEHCGPVDWSGAIHGISRRVDRIRSLGNAVVPQIVTWIGNQILAYERSRDPVSIGKEGV